MNVTRALYIVRKQTQRIWSIRFNLCDPLELRLENLLFTWQSRDELRPRTYRFTLRSRSFSFFLPSGMSLHGISFSKLDTVSKLVVVSCLCSLMKLAQLLLPTVTSYYCNTQNTRTCTIVLTANNCYIDQSWRCSQYCDTCILSSPRLLFSRFILFYFFNFYAFCILVWTLGEVKRFVWYTIKPLLTYLLTYLLSYYTAVMLLCTQSPRCWKKSHAVPQVFVEGECAIIGAAYSNDAVVIMPLQKQQI